MMGSTVSVSPSPVSYDILINATRTGRGAVFYDATTHMSLESSSWPLARLIKDRRHDMWINSSVLNLLLLQFTDSTYC